MTADDRLIKKAMRKAGIPAYVDYLSAKDEKYKDSVFPIIKDIRNFSHESEFQGFNIYPKADIDLRYSQDIFFLLAKYCVFNKKRVTCISATELAMWFEDGNYDSLPEPKGKLFLYDFCFDASRYNYPYSDQAMVAIRWVIKNYIDNDEQVFLLSDCPLKDASEVWGYSYITNLCYKVQDYKVDSKHG